MENMFAAFVGLIVVLNVFKGIFRSVRRGIASAIKRKEEQEGGVRNKLSKKELVVSMATNVKPDIAPALLEEKDYSEYDIPTFLRLKHKDALAASEETKKKIAQQQAKPQGQKPAKAPRNPKISLEEFQKNAGAKAATYEKV